MTFPDLDKALLVAADMDLRLAAFAAAAGDVELADALIERATETIVDAHTPGEPMSEGYRITGL